MCPRGEITLYPRRRSRIASAATPYPGPVPEGDTLHKIANRLRPALVGPPVARFDAPRLDGPRPRAGAAITSVEARGKHLLVSFDDGTVVETHLRMTGSWHLYTRGERWRKPTHLARVVIETDAHVAVCFSAPVVRSHRGQVRADRALDHLGPDLCRPDADLSAAVERMARYADADTSIADALLDQRVASGIGNVFKSEVLWAARLDPFTPVRNVPVELRRRLVELAANQLRANLTTARRTTVPGGLAVYRKARRPCRRCGTPITTARQGPNARSTYWCPRCQVPPAPSPSPSASDPPVPREGSPRSRR
jgi:endonuclease VIII